MCNFGTACNKEGKEKTAEQTCKLLLRIAVAVYLPCQLLDNKFGFYKLLLHLHGVIIMRSAAGSTALGSPEG